MHTLPTNPRRLIRSCIPGAALVLICIIGSEVFGAPPSTASKKPGQFGPGIRIDWQHRLVEVDAEVVLRKGALELFACSPQSREHESILRVHARPMHIFQALGLLGLTPGTPTAYDDKLKRWKRPTGAALALSVRHTGKGGSSEVPIERWLRDVLRDRSPDRLNWVFAGSRTLESGKFAADIDGTIACVVDFDSALIALADLHSADNEDLWLEANTESIPPIGTRCTLVIQAAHDADPAPVVHMSADGSLRHGRKPITMASVARLAAESSTNRTGKALFLEIEIGVSEADRARLLGALGRAGIDRARIGIRAAKPNSPHPQAGSGSGG